MESVKRRNLSLRSFFLLTVFATFCGMVLLSGLTIWGCMAFRSYLLPDPNAAYLTVERVMEDGTVVESSTWLDFGEETKLPELRAEEDGAEVHEEVADATYSIQKIEKSFDRMGPRRKLAYRFCGAAMVAVPAMLSITGILLAGFIFYQKRLAQPLWILSNATAQIAAQNLDFTIEYACGDEMGELCGSFERMRGELAENNKAMWRLLDQRRLMQASIAHDLRNPIAIIEGYTEYLQTHLPKGDLSPEKTDRVVENLKLAAKRLEQYTESVRALNRLEDMEADRREVSARELMDEICGDFQVMADRAGVALHMERQLTEEYLMVDRTMFFRILENVFENAARFARSVVSVDFEQGSKGLTVTVADDGAGFPEEVLKKRGRALLPTGRQDGHLGMGLAISQVLCGKHGGSLKLGNRKPCGAEVKIFITV